MDNRFYKPACRAGRRARATRRRRPTDLIALPVTSSAKPPLHRPSHHARIDWPRGAPTSFVGAVAAAACLAASTPAAAADDASPRLKLQPELSPYPAGDKAANAPLVIRAKTLRGRPDQETIAEGDVEFRRAGTVLRADRVDYDIVDDRVVARGHVRISRDGAVYSGPELQLKVRQFEGFFLSPKFDFGRIDAGGSADRIDFIDSTRASAVNARYTSCPRDGSADPAWLLTTRRIRLDFEANEGIAEGAVLSFLGVPILGAPSLSFPINDQRKSGWLPPNVKLDNRSGFEIAVPWYWNIAPNRDATITPKLATRRGLGGEFEFRYLEPAYEGAIGLDLWPHDRAAGRERHALRLQHEGAVGGRLPWLAGARYALQGARVSDDDWWKDFPGTSLSFTQRLLSQQGTLERPFAWAGGHGLVYARAQHWQVLQSADAITSPFQRSPQVGLHWQGELGLGLRADIETEINRFTLPGSDAANAARPTGSRWHAVGTITRPWRGPGWWVVPGVALNTASYDTEGRTSASRTIPTVSVDAGAEFERGSFAFGRALRQTLEPRVRYARTPFRDQSAIPNYDAAGKDFNFTSIYSDNAWSGIDRVSDSHQLTFGATSRLVDAGSGAELLRLGLVQRLLFRPQRVTPDDTDAAADAAEPLTRRLSDLLLVGSTAVIPRWNLDATVRYNADLQRPMRSILAARYTPGDFKTVSATYRYTRGQSELVDVGWQWPIGRLGAQSGSGCNGRLYSVGRMNYSLRDSRITDSLLGLEFDAGCWIGRVVAERVSTGRTEATTRLLLQLELVGLSRLGSNPLKVLKDNIPGYRLLREERGDVTGPSPYD
jgi:LPS-assembly protein